MGSFEQSEKGIDFIMQQIKLTFSGDIMLDNEIIHLYEKKTGNYDFNCMFADIKKFLEQAELVIGNLETPITTNNKEIKSKLYQFTSPIEFAEAVKDAGFDFVTTANNHCLDNGIEGIKKTLDALEKVRT